LLSWLCAVHTEESVELLQMKIVDHRKLFITCFPNERLKPKHHYLEHYAHQIRQFGPLIACSTIRFEAKHNYFKQIVHGAKNFKNLLLTLCQQHQLMQAYYLSTVHYLKCDVVFKCQKEVGFYALHQDVQEAIKAKFGSSLLSNLESFCLAETIAMFGVKYTKGLFVVTHFIGCLPSFSEIIHLFDYVGNLILLLETTPCRIRNDFIAMNCWKETMH
jgi:hypothetical protein